MQLCQVSTEGKLTLTITSSWYAVAAPYSIGERGLRVTHTYTTIQALAIYNT